MTMHRLKKKQEIQIPIQRPSVFRNRK